MIRRYKDAGYSTVFVTDHFQASTIEKYGDIPWDEKMSIFLAGYYLAKCEGEKIGITVLPAIEICFNTFQNNHYLVYGITKKFLDSYPELYTYGIEKFSEIARNEGLFIVQAHPYRDGESFPTPEYVDAIEIYNSNPRHLDYSDKSESIAKQFGLYVSAGSDTHAPEDIALSGIETDEEIKTSRQFIELVKNKNVRLIRGGK
jgi:predicted metal-dependent phosphoesterase TrpH